MFHDYKRKAGYLASACSLFEAYHSLGCKQTELIPTPLVYKYAPKGVREGMDSLRHTNGNGIYLPVASTSAMFSTTNSIVVVSNSQKQSVSDAFQNVVLPPYSRSDLLQGGTA